MDIRIEKASHVPLRRQLAEQIVYLIVTGKLKPGEALPSVRELGRRLKVHHNTVSEAYRELVRRTWLEHRRGSRLVVRRQDDLPRSGGFDELDDLINQTIEKARQCGYSLQQLRGRVRERLIAEPPDHILVVEEEPGLRSVIEEEIRAAGKWPVEGCSPADLARSPGLAVGALITAPHFAMSPAQRGSPKEFPPIPLAFSGAEEHLALLRKQREPSVVAVVSVSGVLLATARGLLAPAIGQRHSYVEYLAPLADPAALRGVDLVFCDLLAQRQVKSNKRILYRLIDRQSVRDLTAAMITYGEGKR